MIQAASIPAREVRARRFFDPWPGPAKPAGALAAACFSAINFILVCGVLPIFKQIFRQMGMEELHALTDWAMQLAALVRTSSLLPWLVPLGLVLIIILPLKVGPADRRALRWSAAWVSATLMQASFLMVFSMFLPLRLGG
jgi:type II secretory pathway component PulF